MKHEIKLSEHLTGMFEFENEAERLSHKASMVSLRVLAGLKSHMKENGISKAELASRIGTSKSYITQLFTGDKLVNMKFLARVEEAFGQEFTFGYGSAGMPEPEIPNDKNFTRTPFAIAVISAPHSSRRNSQPIYILPSSSNG